MNYENDAALGISSTEFTRNAAAVDLFGKEFNKLTELQKQQTLLKMVEDGNKLSGALGQASREGGGFENTIGNLRQAWQDLLARLGTPILNTVVGVLQKLTDVVNAIQPQKFIDFFRQATGEGGKLKPIIDGVKNTISTLVNQVIVPLIPVAISMFQRMYEIVSPVFQKVFSLIQSIGNVIASLVNDFVVPLIPVFMSVIQTAFKIVAPILQTTWSIFGQIVDVITFLVNSVVIPLIPVIATTVQSMWETLSPILDFIADKFQSIADVIQNVIGFVGDLASSVKNLDIGGKIASVGEKIKGVIPGFNSGLGNVPYDNMVARLHKGEAVLQEHNAQALRNAGILKGDGRNPELDLSATTQIGASSFQTAPSMTTNNSKTASVSAPVTIYVQGGSTNNETASNIKSQLESFFLDLRYQMEG